MVTVPSSGMNEQFITSHCLVPKTTTQVTCKITVLLSLTTRRCEGEIDERDKRRPSVAKHGGAGRWGWCSPSLSNDRFKATWEGNEFLWLWLGLFATVTLINEKIWRSEACLIVSKKLDYRSLAPDESQSNQTSTKVCPQVADCDLSTLDLTDLHLILRLFHDMQ